jgi:hypothetical protein
MDLVKTRDTFRELADITDELIEIESQEETPEIKKQFESTIGRYVIKLIELKALQE